MASYQASPSSWDPQLSPPRRQSVPTWLLVVLLVLVFPAGLVLLWTSSHWRWQTRALITSVVLLVAAASLTAVSLDRELPSAAPPPDVLAVGHSPAPTHTAKPASSAKPPVSGLPSTTALGMLSDLQVRDEPDPPGVPPYDRTNFGLPWADTDRNGCDTRNDVLRRDLTNVVAQAGTGGCVVQSGDFIDPYNGVTQHYDRAREKEVLVDHVVSLFDAWRANAYTWPLARRMALANDPLELMAVSDESNTTKGDSTADAWLPPETSYDCAFAARQVGVKVKYGLTVTAEEKRALQHVLEDCLGEPAVTGGLPTLAP